MDAQGCFLELEKQTGYGRMIFKDCKKKKPNKQTYKTNTKGKWMYFKERVLAISHDYRLDWSYILHISLFQLQQRCHFPSLSSNLRKFEVKMQKL